MSDEPVVVYTSQGPLGAEVALGKLRSEGILAVLRYEAVGRALGLTVDGLGLVQVLVAAEDAEKALEILRETGYACGLEGEAPGDDTGALGPERSGPATKRSLGPRTLLYPTPLLVVGTYDAARRPNIMAAAWGGICCSRPPCVYVSLRPATYTHGLIQAGACYTLSIPSARYVREADYAGLASGREVSKFEELGLTPVHATHVDAPYVGEFPVALECRLRQTVEVGSHTQFIGEVLDVLVDEDLLDAEGNPDIERIRPVMFDPHGRKYYGLGPLLGDAFSIGRREA